VRAPAAASGSSRTAAAGKPGQDAAVVDRATVSSPPSITGFGEGDLHSDVVGSGSGDGAGTGEQA
jgi:hypothetical protein